MRRVLVLFLTLFLLSGCGSNGFYEKNTTTPPSYPIEDKYFTQQWYLHHNALFYANNNIDPEASIHYGERYNYAGKGVKIAIIDNGLDITHPDLQGRITSTYSIVRHTTNVAPLKSNANHGTAVTGIIASNANTIGIKGIASQSQIMFLQYDENMSDSDTIQLFLQAKEWGADIISNSWGTYNVSDAVKSVIVDLAKNGRNGKGIVFVFAVGNDAIDASHDESSIKEVISVGATDTNNLRAWYSNFGENLDVLAPGGYNIGITTLDPVGQNGVATIDADYNLANDFESFRGTSASAPIVAGVIAMMLEKNPNLTRSKIEKLLHKTSDKIGPFKYINGRNLYYGYGKINVTKLINSF